MAIKLQIRRDILINWNANPNVVLLEGEIGYVTDTRNMKIGDGLTVWSSLKYQAPYYTGTNSSLLTTTLSVDQTNNRVGIGTTSPQSPLHVGGQITFGTIGASNQLGSDGSNNVLLNAWNGHVFQCGGTEKVRIAPTGLVGIGTNNPLSQVHIEGTAPVIRLKDTTSGTAEYASVDADTSTGSISVNANPGNVASVASSSLVVLKVNGAERLRANDTGVAITGTTISSGALTVSTGGLTVSAGTVTVPTGSISGAALANNGVTFAKLPQVSTPSFIGTPAGTSSATNVSALTQAQAQTMLGIPTNIVGAGTVVGTQNTTTQKNASLSIGNWAQFELQYAAATTVGVAGHTWLYLACRQSSGGSSFSCAILTGQQTMADIATATGLSASSGWNFCVCRVA